MLGLLVRRNDDFGRPAALQAVVSTIVFYLTLATSGLLLLVVLVTDRRRTLHDLVSGLVVVRIEAIQPLTPPFGYGNIPGGSSYPMSYKPPRRPQFFYTTAPLPCPYLAGRTERKVVTEITGPDADSLHDRLSRAGFRRSHNIAYAPVCPSCQACVPIRIPVATFQPGRTLRRIARANASMEGFEVPARATAEQFQLFQRYQQSRHGEGDMATMSFYDYRAMVEDTPIETFIVEFRDPDDRLVGACLTDKLGDGLSAVLQLLRAGAGETLAGHLRDPVADRARASGWPALRVSRLLGAGEQEDGVQVEVPAERDSDRRHVADDDRRRSGCQRGGARGAGAGVRQLTAGGRRGKEKSKKTPSPLEGEGWGEGCELRGFCVDRPLSPTLPLKGGGSLLCVLSRPPSPIGTR